MKLWISYGSIFDSCRKKHPVSALLMKKSGLELHNLNIINFDSIGYPDLARKSTVKRFSKQKFEKSIFKRLTVPIPTILS